MAKFSIATQTPTPAAAFCAMAGELDEAAFEAAEEEFGKVLSAGMKAVVLDLSKLERLTSPVLGAIINMGRLLGRRGGMLVLVRPNPENEGLLELLGLKESLTVADTPDAARKLIANIR